MQTKSKKKTTKYLIIILAILLIGGGAYYYTHRTTETTGQSYSVNQTATLRRSTRLYDSLSLRHSTTASTNSTVNVNRYYLTTVNKEQRTYARVNLSGKTYYVNTKNLTLSLSNGINQYIARLSYPHTTVTHKIDSNFNQRGYSTSSGRPRGVVVHDTGTDGSTLSEEVRFMEQNYRSTDVFVHTFIDANEIRNIANTRYMAEGAGPKANPYYVQFEMPHETSASAFADQLGNAAYYTAYTLKKNDLPVIVGRRDGSGTIWTHYMVTHYLGGTDHEDPNDYWNTAARRYFGTTYNINDFVQLVQAYYNRI